MHFKKALANTSTLFKCNTEAGWGVCLVKQSKVPLKVSKCPYLSSLLPPTGVKFRHCIHHQALPLVSGRVEWPDYQSQISVVLSLVQVNNYT